MKTIKSPRLLWCCVVLPLLLAGCNTGFSQKDVNAMRSLTPKQRDQVGYELAAELRRTSLSDTKQYRIRDIRYRSNSDTLVYDVEMKGMEGYKPDAATRKRLKQEGDKLIVQAACENRKMRSVVMDARFGIEFRMKNGSGVELMRPRIAPGGCP